MHIKNKKYWVTLVELIIGVTIVIVLWTIGLISFQSYALTIRDTSRITDIEKISVALEDYKIRNRLPQPDNYVSIEQWNKLISQQWELTKDILHLIEFERGWLDPKNQDFYTYTRSGNNKYFQIMWLLEDDRNVPANKNQPDIQISAERFPYSQWSKLWILTDEKNIPIEKKLAGENIQIDNQNTPLLAYLENNHFTYGTGSILSGLEQTNKQWGKYCKVKENNTISCNTLADQRRKWTWFESISWNQAIWYNDLPENIQDIFDKDLPYVAHWKDNNCLKENIEVVQINTSNFNSLCTFDNKWNCKKHIVQDNKIYVFEAWTYSFVNWFETENRGIEKVCNAIIWDRWNTIFQTQTNNGNIFDGRTKWNILYWFVVDWQDTSRWVNGIKLSEINITMMNIEIKNTNYWIEATTANGTSWYILWKNLNVHDNNNWFEIHQVDNAIFSNINIYNNGIWFHMKDTNTSISNGNIFNNNYWLKFNGWDWVMNNANIFNNQYWVNISWQYWLLTFNNNNVYNNNTGIFLWSNREYQSNNLVVHSNDYGLYNDVWTVTYFWNLHYYNNNTNIYNKENNWYLLAWEENHLFTDWKIISHENIWKAIPDIVNWSNTTIWINETWELRWFSYDLNLAKQTQPLRNGNLWQEYYWEDRGTTYDYDSSKFIWEWE